MQLSLGKLAVTLITLLVVVTLLTTGIGFSVLLGDYRSLEQRHEAEARDTVRNASLAIASQIRFYQGMVRLISARPKVVDLLQFGTDEDIAAWSTELRQLLPGVLGATLVSSRGELRGNPLARRIGPICIADMKRLFSGSAVDFPPLHSDIAGLEHFDLLSHVVAPNGESSGSLAVNFRTGFIENMLHSLSTDGDRFELRDGNGNVHLIVGEAQLSRQETHYKTRVPDTSWELSLHRENLSALSSYSVMMALDALILIVAGGAIVLAIRAAMSRFTSDLGRVHAALDGVLSGNYQASDQPTAFKETQRLLPQIEQLAADLQRQRNNWRHQSLSDPLTGVYNRRYFDMMLAHLHEQSLREQPAYLVIVDLNDFKQINDEFGHQVGDEVLRDAARFLSSRVRTTDIVTRIGGDEFALLLTRMADDIITDWITALIHDYDHREIEPGRHDTVFCQLSIGAALIDARVYPTPGDAYAAADHAMYKVKQRRNVQHSRFALADHG